MTSDVEPKLQEAIESGDTRRALIGLRDHIVRELDGQRCLKCSMSQLKSGDQASLILRLQQILVEIEKNPSAEQQARAEASAKSEGKVRSLADIRGSRDATASAEDDRQLGTKSAARRQGGPRRGR